MEKSCFQPILSVITISLLLAGCSLKETSNEQNIHAAVHSMFEDGWNSGDTGVFDESIADSVLFHYAGSPREMTRGEMSEIVLRWREAFPDLRMDIQELVIRQDLAAARLTLTGTHEGPWAGAEPTGKQVSMALMMFFRFEDGKMVELWESDDQLGFRRQLGIIP